MLTQMKALYPSIACHTESLGKHDENILGIAPTAFKECGSSQWVHDYQQNLVEGALKMMTQINGELVDCRM